MTKSIPSSVLNLLTDRRTHTPGRLTRYIHRPEDRSPRNGLTWPEARALIDDGVVDNDWIGPGAAIAVLDHEQAAACKFRDEVFQAWDRLHARLEAPERMDEAA
jgi:hypothetical protein